MLIKEYSANVCYGNISWLSKSIVKISLETQRLLVKQVVFELGISVFLLVVKYANYPLYQGKFFVVYW